MHKTCRDPGKVCPPPFLTAVRQEDMSRSWGREAPDGLPLAPYLHKGMGRYPLDKPPLGKRGILMDKRCWCGNTSLEVWSDTYSRCPECETLVDVVSHVEDVYNVTDDGKSLYDESYWRGKMADLYKDSGCSDIDDIILLHYRERAAHWVKHIMCHVPYGAKVLEMGCGLGTLTRWLLDLGYDAEATELSPAWSDFLRRKQGLTIRDPAAVPSLHPAERYDAIIAMDVLEHLPDPVGELEKIAATLTDTGILVLQLPCYHFPVTHAELVAQKSHFLNMLLPGEHVFLYSPHGLIRLLQRCGFQHIKARPNIFPTDIFVFASRAPLPEFSEQEVRRTFLSNPQSITAYAALENSRLLNAARHEYQRKFQELAKRVNAAPASPSSAAPAVQPVPAAPPGPQYAATPATAEGTAFDPSEKRPRVAYVDHSYHKQTLSNDFIVDILNEFGCEVVRFWDDSWQGGSAVNLHELASFDALVLFQQTGSFNAPSLSAVHPNITYIPMLDNFRLTYGRAHDITRYWKQFQGVKFVNFSRTLHYIIQACGLSSRYFQYFQPPDPAWQAPAQGLHGFFWCRRPDQISFEHIRALLGGTRFDSLHLHLALDPGMPPVPLPGAQDIKRHNITMSTWFENKADYLAALGRANVFFAPRREEGIGQAMLEAFVRGQCVVAPDAGTMNEYIVHGVNGLLYDPDAPAPLDFGRAVALGRRGRDGAAVGHANWLQAKERLVRHILLPQRRQHA